MRVLSAIEANQYIAEKISSKSAFLASRFGSVEAKIAIRLGINNQQRVSKQLMQRAQVNAGICQPSLACLRRFSHTYLSAAANMDFLGTWEFKGHLDIAQYIPIAHQSPLDNFDPFKLAIADRLVPWTASLEGKKVLIIHPFKSSIEQQLNHLEDIALVKNLLPHFDFQIVAPPVTNGDIEYNRDWGTELSMFTYNLIKQHQINDFDVALVGAGSYGLPIGSFLKTCGLTVIHLGGALQLLFGIMGARWANKPFWQDRDLNGWIKPLPSDTPNYARKIENGCYW